MLVPDRVNKHINRSYREGIKEIEVEVKATEI